MVQDKLNDYKERQEKIVRKFNELKNKSIRLEEQKKMLLAEMKEKFDCDSPAELEVKMKKMKDEITDLEGRIEPLLANLEDTLFA